MPNGLVTSVLLILTIFILLMSVFNNILVSQITIIDITISFIVTNISQGFLSLKK